MLFFLPIYQFADAAPEEPESPTSEAVLPPETEVEQREQQPNLEETTQPQESLDEVLTVSLITSEEDQPLSEAVTTETILTLDQPIETLETEDASTAPEISVVEEITEIIPSEISQQEQPEEETKQEVDLVQGEKELQHLSTSLKKRTVKNVVIVFPNQVTNTVLKTWLIEIRHY